ncbi:MAG: M48 family metalloprotease, partial [Xanthomonadales bacterium]|nr:M48 family metalloprotease [Xanthomonadales bacterium]NIO14267.1 M48 family metalloprotease [Xanthomonadales bacterium]
MAIAWALGCLLLAARLVVGHARARRLVAESRAMTDRQALGARAELCAEAGVRREVGLRVSGSVGAPVLYGVKRPTILLPEDWVESLAAEDLRALLAHEVAHVRRGDCLANLVQRICEIPAFFHPAVWLASRRIALAREELADGWALSRGVDARGYARSLAAAAERAQGRLG